MISEARRGRLARPSGHIRGLGVIRHCDRMCPHETAPVVDSRQFLCLRLKPWKIAFDSVLKTRGYIDAGNFVMIERHEIRNTPLALHVTVGAILFRQGLVEELREREDMANEVPEDPALNISHRIVGVGRRSSGPGRRKDPHQVRDEAIKELAAQDGNLCRTRCGEVSLQGGPRVNRKFFFRQGGNRRLLMACDGPFGHIEDRVRAFGHEIVFLECQAKPPVNAGVPAEFPLRDIAEADWSKATDELVLT